MAMDIPIQHTDGWNLHAWAFDQDALIIKDIYYNDSYRLRRIPPFGPAEVIVDVGACIGAFERLARHRSPDASIFCIEVCPENIPILQANVSPQTRVIQAAVSYRSEPLSLLNAVFPKCDSTGGSILCTAEELDRIEPDVNLRSYHPDRRFIEPITLEQMLDRHGAEAIDILKLDCEGSEFDILEHCDLDRIRMIVGEYHGWERFQKLCTSRFPDPEWHCHVWTPGDLGIFWLFRLADRDRLGI